MKERTRNNRTRRKHSLQINASLHVRLCPSISGLSVVIREAACSVTRDHATASVTRSRPARPETRLGVTFVITVTVITATIINDTALILTTLRCCRNTLHALYTVMW